MEFLLHRFAVSQVETYIFIPTLFTFFISFFLSMGGTTGAFLLIPFQISVLGFNSTSVTATSFIYNILAIPLGFTYKVRKHEMCWPLFWLFLVGTFPGLFLGYIIRVSLLRNPENFKLFVGIIMFLIGFGGLAHFKIKDTKNSFLKVNYFWRNYKKLDIVLDNSTYSINPLIILLVSIFIGIISGIYGVGGGVFLSSFCILILNLPPVIISGSTLAVTWINSVIATLIYYLDPLNSNTMPDIPLGILFGLGGIFGVYLGLKLQKFFPQIFIKLLYIGILLFLSLKYIFF